MLLLIFILSVPGFNILMLCQEVNCRCYHLTGIRTNSTSALHLIRSYVIHILQIVSVLCTYFAHIVSER